MATAIKKIGIVGSGLIGQSWCMLFASAGYQVILYDILSDQIEKALKTIRTELKDLETKGLLRGKLNADQQYALVSSTNDLKILCNGVIFIQECIPERLDMKQSLLKQLDELVDDRTIISSSTSTFLPSLLTKDLKHKENMLVSHPVNPPYYVPLVEIVPAPWTKPNIIKITRNLMLEIGQKPITLAKEIEGFALNRIQYVILNECWRLIDAGILNVQDVDSVMSDGLGMRYAFLGPFETAHLNADGMANYLERYAKTIYSVSETMGPIPKMEGDTAKEISRQLENTIPLDKLVDKRKYRDNCLMQLSKLKEKLPKEKSINANSL